MVVNILRKFAERRATKKQQRVVLDDLDAVVHRRVNNLRYPHNAGAVGVVSSFDDFDYVRGEGFLQCAGVCIRDADKQLFMHVSPTSLQGIAETVRGYDSVNEAKMSFIEALCRGLEMFDSGRTGYLGNQPFSGFDLKKLQKRIDSNELSCDVIAGDDNTGGAIAIDLSDRSNHVSTHSFPSGFSVHGIPRFNVSLYDFGVDKKTIYSGKDNSFVLFDDRVYEMGINFPTPQKFPTIR